MQREATRDGWRALARPEWLPALTVLLGGVLLQSMNVLLLATVLPTIVAELGGEAVMHWPTTAFVAASIVAALCTGVLVAVIGARATFCAGALVFGTGAVLCWLATTMAWIIAGRFVQGLGGGLLIAVAYVLVRNTLPEAMWSRALALLSGMWSVSILVGPLVGGAFARYGDWRNAFVLVTVFAAILALGAFRALPATPPDRTTRPGVPAGRMALICLIIAGTSSAAVVATPLAKAGLIAFALVALVVMVRIDRRATSPLLPSDAFSFGTPTGVGLWLVLLLSVTYSPLQIYVAIFLQRLHGLDPLAAGYAVAGASFGWTGAALLVAGAEAKWQDRLIVLGPLVMGAGLLAIAGLMTLPLGYAVVPAVVLTGAGIGICWAFVAQRVMSGARRGDETVAASSLATVQQLGFAIGAAFAGLIANASGLAHDVRAAAFWVPVCFVAAAAAAFVAALRLRAVR
jgi:MFS family permease